MSEITATQADRQAAADLWINVDGDTPTPEILQEAERYRKGLYDHTPAVQAFARHRTQAAGEPVAWQRRRMWSYSFDPAGKVHLWEPCTAREATGHFEKEAGYEYRALYAHPPTPTPATDQSEQADVVDRVARILAPRLEGGREFDQMPANRRELKIWSRNGMALINDTTQDDAIEAAQAAIAAMQGPDVAALVERYRHVKRGTIYEIIGEAELQMNAYSLVDGSQMMVYRGEDGKLWCRHFDEFHDGRFVALAAIAIMQAVK